MTSLAVGTELLLGQIVDTNSAWIGEQLALNGIASLTQVKVGDNVGRIVAALRRLLEDADAVIVCGGLGPTHDDLTREAIAEVMGVELVADEAVADVIRQLFAARGRRMPENNLRQALVPVGATVIPQTRGTAPGLICPVDGGGKVVYAVPGVPHEMREMLERAVLPDLRAAAGEPGVIASRVLRTWGESESGLNERLDGVIARLDAEGDPTLAFLASGWEGLEVRLTTRQADVDARGGRARPGGGRAARPARPARVRRRRRVDGVGGARPAARRSGLTLGLAESLTGGLVAARLTAIPGASDVLRGAVVSYASEVKFDLLGVAGRAGRQRGRRRWRWPRACSGCSAPTSASASPASPARPSRTASPSARCASASPCRPARTPRPLRLGPSASRSASSP